jgi:hypothetical protein
MNQRELKKLFDTSTEDIYYTGNGPWYNSRKSNSIMIGCITYNASQFATDYHKDTKEYFYIENRDGEIGIDEIIRLAPSGNNIFESWRRDYVRVNK